MVEIWKDIVGYEGLYQVSNMGRVKNSNYQGTEKEIILKQSKTFGYLKLTLYKNGKIKTYKVHRLIGQAFIPNPDNKPEINHIDGNKANNIVNNLEWVTSKQNTEHAIKTGLQDNKGIKNNKSKLTELQILEIRNKYSTGKYFQQDLADEYSVHQSTIGRIINNKNWSHLRG